MYDGWIKLHRKALDNPIVMKDAEHLAIWTYLLLNATHAEYPALFKGNKIMLQPGQLITGSISIGNRLSINESKVRRVLNNFVNDGQIDRQTSNKNSLITVLNWDMYQNCDGQNDKQVTDECRTSDGQVTTNKNVKNVKKDICTPEASVDALEEYKKNFEIIYKLYPKKVGKTRAFTLYKAWVSKGRKVNGTNYKLTNRQIYIAVQKYVRMKEEAGVDDLQYWKEFDSLMGNNLLDYVDFEE